MRRAEPEGFLKITVVGPASPRQFAEVLGLPSVSVPVGLGGTPINALVAALLDQGHAVHLVTLSPDVERTFRADSGKLSIAVVPYRQARRRILDFFRSERQGMRQEISARESHVIHAHWTYEFAWSALGTGVPLVVTAHDSPFTVLRRSPSVYRVLRTVMALRVRPSVRTLTAVSPYLAERWRVQLRYTRRPIHVITNPVPIEPKDRKTKVHSASRPIILDIANGAPLKNVKLLIRAFAEFRVTNESAELRLIGPELGQGSAISHWASAAGRDTGVNFLGPLGRAEVIAHLGEATIFAHTSLEESQGMSLLEAMASGAPILAGRASGAVAWTLGNGKAGHLVDVTSVAAVARGLERLVKDEAYTRQLVAQGRDLIATRYAPGVIASAYIDVYRVAIAEGKKSK